jgi:invasion protein IalB
MSRMANHGSPRRFCAAALTCAFAAIAVHAAAQEQSFWAPGCRAAADDTSRMICTLTQDVRREGGGELLFRLEAQTGAKPEDNAFRIISPLGTYLINGLGLVVDDVELGRIPVERCAAQGCLSLVRQGPELEAILAGLQGGQQLELVFWLAPEEQKSVEIPLTGFGTNWLVLKDKL